LKLLEYMPHARIQEIECSRRFFGLVVFLKHLVESLSELSGLRTY